MPGLLGFWDFLTIFCLASLFVAVVVEFSEEIFHLFLVHRSARRLGLRDKGENEGNVVHTLCNTPVRIGIDSDKEAQEYCWRCEYIFYDDDEPDPKDREDLPVDTKQVVDATEKGKKVVNLLEHKKQRKAA